MSLPRSSRAPLAAVLVALQVHGCAPAGDAGEPARAPGSPLAVPGLAATFDPRFARAAARRLVTGNAQTARWDRLAATPGSDVADEISVHTAFTRDGKAIEAVVALTLPLSFDVVWAVLNDYENMPRFVPDITATRLISIGPASKRVEIEGVARLLFMEYPTRTTLDVAYRPDGTIALDSVAGNLAVHGIARVRGDRHSTRVSYQVVLTPDFWLPPLIGDYLIGRQITRQFEGMVAEMHRRANSRQTRGPDTAPPGDRRPGARTLIVQGRALRWVR